MRAAATVEDQDEERDFYGPVMRLGSRAMTVGAILGVIIGMATHGWAASKALGALVDMQHLLQSERSTLHEFFWATYDVEVEKPPPPPDPKVEDVRPEPPKEPDPEPAPKAPPQKEKEIYDTPPPAPARAAAVLTREASPNDKVEDMTDSIVSGDGKATGGMVSANGIGEGVVTNPNARVGGVIGGTGTGAPKPPPPPPPGPDLSRPPGLLGGSGGNWNCPFPPEADGDDINKANVVIRVTVRSDGAPSTVSVVSDPGHGFGRAARSCALGRRFTPGLDKGGQPTTMSTPNITVRFTR